MGLREVRKRLTATTEELHHDSLRGSWEEHGAVHIADAADRQVAVVGGEVQGVQVVPRAGSPSLEVTVHDGTGRAVAVFTGRRAIGGVTPGRHLLLEGLGRRDRNRLLFVNPAYTLLRS